MTITKLDQLLGGGSAPSSPATVRTPSTVEPTFAKPRVAILDESPSVEGAGVDRAPGDHSTGAHYLMRQWSQIKAWYTQAGVYDESYVINLEEEQGVLRLLSYGTSGPGGTFTGVNPRSPPSADRGISHPSPPADEVYLNSYGQRDYIKPYNLGGLNADKSLRIDCTTVKRLFDAYMKNIWVMYPMFAFGRIKAQAENFMRAAILLTMSSITLTLGRRLSLVSRERLNTSTRCQSRTAERRDTAGRRDGRSITRPTTPSCF